MENQTMTLAEKALLMHEKWNGKLETIAKSKVNSREDLAHRIHTWRCGAM